MDIEKVTYEHEMAEARALEYRRKTYTCGDCEHCRKPEDEGFFEFRGIGFCTETDEFVNTHVLADDMDCDYISPEARS